jgi:uncharacterized protein
MKKEFLEAIKSRRSIYGFENRSPISDTEIKNILTIVLTNVPSAFNSQSARFVLLLNENHRKLWNITKEVLRGILPSNRIKATEEKIDNSFATGYGTILFFEDQEVIENFQTQFPAYADNFPGWSAHSSGMHQFAVWTMLADAGLGASLQHYNPLIDERVRNEWNINPKWKLIAQMPFGVPTAQPGEKEIEPLDKRLLIY